MMRSYISTGIFILILGIAVGTEHYIDYGEENVDRDLENVREFYRLLLQRNFLDNNVDSPYEHLMIRKSQRSPSLRLRFGRSGPSIPPAGLLGRSVPIDNIYEKN